MEYRIIGDSCLDLLKEDRKKEYLCTVPLTIMLDDETFIDDESFNQKMFLEKVANSPNCPKSSCPTPEHFMEQFDLADECYVITLSSKLSGSYNSACVAKQLYEEEHEGKKIHIFDSKSASSKQTLIYKKIEELKQKGCTFEEVVEQVEAYIADTETMFVLESLEALRKNGRLSKVKALVATALNIKPLMGADSEGNIIQLGQARGVNKALQKLIDSIGEKKQDIKNRRLVIAHCNCESRAKWVKEQIEKVYEFAEIIIVETAGISTLYASDGGIIVAF
ncbi:MAG: DegV family protein [Lachnospiraceae bacterium]|nr:DegV family protein [Lachnospiraceae bacterium]